MELTLAHTAHSHALIDSTAIYGLAAVINRYTELTATPDDEGCTHTGASPFVRGDTMSLDVDATAGTYLCNVTQKTGRVLDFVMFMEECSPEEAAAWLEENFPGEFADELSSPAEVVQRSGLLPIPAQSASVEPAYTQVDDASEFDQLAAITEVPDTEQQTHDAPEAINDILYKTTNYDLFHRLPENRPLRLKQVRRLVREISRANLLEERPMNVTVDMGIIDGHHRLEAARELGIPIFYRIGKKLSGAAIRSLNVASQNWIGTDYLHHWAVLGKPDYQLLIDFMGRYPILSFSNAVLLLQDTEETKTLEFQDGLWTASESQETANETADFIQRIGAEVPTFRQAKSSRFISAVLYCIKSVAGFSSEKFLKKILRAPLELVPCGNRKQYLVLFSTIYNFGVAKEQRITFS